MKKLLAVLLGVALVMGFAITKAEAGTSAGLMRVGATLAGYDWRKASIDVPGDPEASTSTLLLGTGAGVTVGYCVNDNIEVGGNILFSQATDKVEVDGGTLSEEVNTDMKIAAYLNYNHPVSDQLVVYPEVLLGYLIVKEEDKEADTEQTISGFILGGGGGIKYFPIEKASVDIGLDFIYGILNTENDAWGIDDDTSGLELLIKAGISLYLGGGK
jgi:hypothetical protein